MVVNDMANTNNSYIVNIEINILHIIDSGGYTCKASVYDTIAVSML